MYDIDLSLANLFLIFFSEATIIIYSVIYLFFLFWVSIFLPGSLRSPLMQMIFIPSWFSKLSDG